MSAVTLVELLMALVLLSLIVLGISQVDFFSSFHLVTTDRRAQISNEATRALEHMNKQIMQAVGNEIIGGADSVVIVVANDPPGDDNNTIRFKVDTSNPADNVADTWRAYLYHNNSAATGKNQIWYCPQCSDSTCATCTPAWGDADNIIAKNIKGFTPSNPVDGSSRLNKNYVTLQIQACWDATQTNYSCGTADNPSVTVKADIRMPSVSTN